MKKIVFMMLSMFACVGSYGQTATSVLDKAAAVVSNPKGVGANFIN